jgi:hypothetical protein
MCLSRDGDGIWEILEMDRAFLNIQLLGVMKLDAGATIEY